MPASLGIVETRTTKGTELRKHTSPKEPEISETGCRRRVATLRIWVWRRADRKDAMAFRRYFVHDKVIRNSVGPRGTQECIALDKDKLEDIRTTKRKVGRLKRCKLEGLRK